MSITHTKMIQGERVKLPTKYGHFELIPFQEKINGVEHIVLIKGDLTSVSAPLVRIHSSCATGDIFGSLRCDCGAQLAQAMKTIETEGCGVIVYLQQEGRGIGLMNKMKAYKLQEEGLDTIEANIKLGFAADERDYGIAVEILKALGVNSLKLMTNNPDKILGLEHYGIQVEDRVPVIIPSNIFNKQYLETKEHDMGHLLRENQSVNMCSHDH
ncbi:GTP cyclohydrolase II [Formosa algae]|uniref:GTP cyclohydrolase II n=1 Tax=Formosa algae TaxID=225843 RepID=UPI000CCE9A46|nr:GTP cyclohydrolase II [Formosa algae]PNW26118.1 GTP cyclohydrolase II [Formosa algae]